MDVKKQMLGVAIAVLLFGSAGVLGAQDADEADETKEVESVELIETTDVLPAETAEVEVDADDVDEAAVEVDIVDADDDADTDEVDVIVTPLPVAQPVVETTTRRLATIYFGPDQVQAFIENLAELDAVGSFLRNEPNAKLIIRGYAANAGYEGGRMDVSRQRAEYCLRYLQVRFGLGNDRFKVEWFGSSRMPESGAKSAAEARCAELIVEETRVIQPPPPPPPPVEEIKIEVNTYNYDIDADDDAPDADATNDDSDLESEL